MSRVRSRALERGVLLLVALATGCSALLLSSPASAAPENTSMSAYRLPCGKAICDDGSSRLSSDEVTDGEIQLQASTSSTLGLQSVEIQMQVSGEWRCLRRWSTSARSGRWQHNLDTRAPIDGCSNTLSDGRNGVYRFRTVATDRSGSDASPAFALRVSNRPMPPTWAASPSRQGSVSDDPAVTLKWFRNPEPDIVEYHFVRYGPKGASEYAVSADRPGGQGCTLEGDLYTCTDDDFPSKNYAGTYRYALVAYRS